MVALGDTLVLPLMDRLLGCLEQEVARTLAGPTCFIGLVPGAVVAMDFCDCEQGGLACGMAWVRLNNAGPSVRFPNLGGSPSSCADPTAASIQLGITRCMPSVDEHGRPPTVPEQDHATRAQMSDYAALRRAVVCCLAGETYVLGPYLPIGPMGGCGGGAITITVQAV